MVTTVRCVAFSPDGRALAVGTPRGYSVFSTDPPLRLCSRMLGSHTGGASLLAFAGRSILAVVADRAPRVVTLWDDAAAARLEADGFMSVADSDGNTDDSPSDEAKSAVADGATEQTAGGDQSAAEGGTAAAPIHIETAAPADATRGFSSSGLPARRGPKPGARITHPTADSTAALAAKLNDAAFEGAPVGRAAMVEALLPTSVGAVRIERRCVAVQDQRSVHIFDTALKRLATYDIHRSSPHSLATAPCDASQSRVVIAFPGEKTGAVRLVEYYDPPPAVGIVDPDGGPTTQTVRRRDGRRDVGASGGGGEFAGVAASRPHIARQVAVEPHHHPVAAIAASADGRVVVSCSVNGTSLKAIDGATGQIRFQLNRGSFPSAILALAVDGVGSMAACISEAGTVHFFALANTAPGRSSGGGVAARNTRSLLGHVAQGAQGLLGVASTAITGPRGERGRGNGGRGHFHNAQANPYHPSQQAARSNAAFQQSMAQAGRGHRRDEMHADPTGRLAITPGSASVFDRAVAFAQAQFAFVTCSLAQGAPSWAASAEVRAGAEADARAARHPGGAASATTLMLKRGGAAAWLQTRSSATLVVASLDWARLLRVSVSTSRDDPGAEIDGVGSLLDDDL